MGVAGYLAELPNPFLNTRWLMLKKLKQHRPVYAVNSVLLLVLWVSTRLILMPSLVIVRVLPRYEDFRVASAMDCFICVTMGHVIVIMMSADWLMKLLRNGLRAFLVFDPNGIAFNPNVKIAPDAKKPKMT